MPARHTVRRAADRAPHAGFALVVAGLAVASAGASNRAWWSLMLAGLALLAVAALARATRRRAAGRRGRA